MFAVVVVDGCFCLVCFFVLPIIKKGRNLKSILNPIHAYPGFDLVPTTHQLDINTTWFVFLFQDRSRPCSRCSQCSSLVSNSPKSEKTFTFKGHLNSSYNEGQGQRSPHRSPNMVHGRVNGIMTKALVHHPLGVDPGENSGEDRKNSLPEIISDPDGCVKKIRFVLHHPISRL